MIKEADQYFLRQPEPTQGCLLAMRHYLLAYEHGGITEVWQYGMPFYKFNGKRLCYLWTDKKTNQPYLGIVDGNLIDHPLLIAEKRARMKIMYLDPNKDLPIDLINTILQMAISVLK